MFGIDDALIAGGMSMAGGFINNMFADDRLQQQQQFSAAQAQQQMDFQERMSNTSYQRGMADMKAAGLNPILAYQKGGASSPTGAMASTPSAQPKVDPITPALSTAMAAKRMDSDLQSAAVQRENVKSDTELKDKQYRTEVSRGDSVAAEADLRKVLIDKAKAELVGEKLDASIKDKPSYRMVRELGLLGQGVNSAISPIVSGVGAARGGVSAWNQAFRWPYP